jgi:shikimate dehydrogenase
MQNQNLTQINNPKIIKSAVIGDPISQSLSPRIHSYWLDKYQISGSYQAIRVEKNKLASAVKNLIEQNFAGFNATIPHKEEIFKMCDKVSETARICKAVNTAMILDDGKIFGHNSDAAGFITPLMKNFPNFVLKNSTAHLIGSGGAARAIIYSLLKFGFKKIVITNRSEEKASQLISEFAEFSNLQKADLVFMSQQNFYQDLTNSDLLINSTSLGMINQERLNFDLSYLNKDAIIYDIVYKPLFTDLILAAKKRGNKTLTGIEMLVEQAAVGFQLWFKQKIEVDKEIVEKAINWSSK